MSVFEARNRVRWEPGESILPMRTVQKGSWIFGLFAVLFGLAWCLALGLSIVFGTTEEGLRPRTTILLVAMMTPGELFLLFGLYQWRARRRVLLERDCVRVTERGLRGSRSWTEPIANYSGVLQRVVRNRGGRGGSGTTRHEVLLVHDDPRREILLFASLGGVGAEALRERTWRSFAVLLDLPVLRENSTGIVAMQVDDLERPLVERVGGSPRTPVLDPEVQRILGRMLDCRQEPDGVVIRFRRAWTVWRPALGLFVSGGSSRSAAPFAGGILTRPVCGSSW